jgi:hypothetical protein
VISSRRGRRPDRRRRLGQRRVPMADRVRHGGAGPGRRSR